VTESDGPDLVVPRDLAAEKAVLSGCMWSPTAVLDVAALLGVDDFFHPHHQTLWSAILVLKERGAPPDPVLLLDYFRSVKVTFDVAYLHSVYEMAPPAGAAQYHAEIVADCATRRRVIQAGRRIQQRGMNAAVDTADLVEWSAEQVRDARDNRKGVEVLTASWEEFLHATPDDRPMVIPGLLGRGDRLVLTGSGGLGKSTLLHQLAVCAAAGIPPMDWHTADTFTPARVVVMDFENPDHRVRTRLWPLVKEAKDAGCPVEDRLRLGGHGNSFDLLNPQNAMSLLRTMEHDTPDLLYIGPAYKLHNDDPDKEVVVKKITAVLDQVREMGVAIITEAHHTKGAKLGGSLEPSGSNLWTWWPEFGLGLRLDKDSDPYVRRCALERWRIDRDANQWPDFVEAGGRWPWARAKHMTTESYV
jgi:hypothetical protein